MINYNNLSSIWQRLKDETPKFWKKIRAIALWASGLATSLLLLQGQVTGFVMPDFVNSFCQYALVGGVVAASLSFLPSNDAKQP